VHWFKILEYNFLGKKKTFSILTICMHIVDLAFDCRCVCLLLVKISLCVNKKKPKTISSCDSFLFLVLFKLTMTQTLGALHLSLFT
jgi:hypothetical protein